MLYYCLLLIQKDEVDNMHAYNHLQKYVSVYL